MVPVWWIILFALQSHSSLISFLLYALGGGTTEVVKRLCCPSGFWPSLAGKRQESDEEEFTLTAPTPQTMKLADGYPPVGPPSPDSRNGFFLLPFRPTPATASPGDSTVSINVLKS